MKYDFNDTFALLDKCMPLVARVHGDGHPELKQVLDAYYRLKESIIAGKDTGAVCAEINTLTNDLTLPADACPTYEKVFAALAVLMKSNA